MANTQINRVLEHLRQAVLGREGGDLTDHELLDCFLAERAEMAFEALVRRHGPMVIGVCRRVLGHPQDAEDAFQATFLVLVRKAASVWPRSQVGPWLHGVAYRTALKARALRLKRQAVEKPLGQAPEPALTAAGETHDWLALLDQELNGLPAKYRVPIVLCDLEGKTHHDAAMHLGWPQGTLAGRLARARNLLGRRLARRGVPVMLATLILGISQQAAAAAVPPALVAATAKAATYVALSQAVSAGAVSTHVAALAEGVMKIMLLGKIKKVLVGLLALVVLATGVGTLAHFAAGSGESPQVPAAGPAAAKGEKSDAVSPQAQALETKLTALGKFRYQNADLMEVLENLKAARKINIVFDMDGLNDAGINAENLKVSLELEDVSLQTALRFALKQANLDFVVQDAVMVVTSRNKALVRKTYPVGPLLGKDEERNASALMQVIMKTIEPQSWAEVEGGFGSLDYFPGTKNLVVRQSAEVHREIADLLKSLAEK